MKLKVVSCRDEIYQLEPHEKYIHLAFRPCVKDFFIIMDRCPKLEIIQLPHSYMSMLAKSLNMYFTNQKIRVIEGAVWGHRKDLNEYYEIPNTIQDEIKSLMVSGIAFEQIMEKISKKYKISTELVAHIGLNIRQGLSIESPEKSS